MRTAAYGLSEAVPQGYIHQTSHKWQAEHIDIDRQAQDRFEKLIEGMKQAQDIKRNA